MAPVLTRAAVSLVESGDAQEARVLRAPGLSARAQAVLQDAASAAGIETHEADADLGAAPLLPAFDLALATSGTACLEATLQGLPTVIGYRTDTFPEFYSRGGNLPVTVRVDTPADAAKLFAVHVELGGGGAILANPLPDADTIPADELADAIGLKDRNIVRVGGEIIQL